VREELVRGSEAEKSIFLNKLDVKKSMVEFLIYSFCYHLLILSLQRFEERAATQLPGLQFDNFEPRLKERFSQMHLLA
jgi:hypothetical protein